MSDLFQALVASGVPHNHAARLDAAIRSAVREEQESAFSSSPNASKTAVPGSAKSYSLYASGPAQYDAESGTFGTGKAALGVSGLACIDGQMVVTGDIDSGPINVEGGVVADSLEAKDIAAERLLVSNTATFSTSAITASVPLIAEKTVVVKDGGQYSGRNVFDGQVVLNKVHWKIDQDPAVVTIPARFVQAGNDLSVETQTVGVLKDHGAGAAQTLSGTLTASSGYAWGGGTVSLQGSNVTVVTGVSFDPDTCSLNVTTTQVFNCTGATLSVNTLVGPFVSAAPWPAVTLSVS